MHKRSLKGNLYRSKLSLKTTRANEDEVIKLDALKTRLRNDLLFLKRMESQEEVLKKEKDFSNLEFQKLVLENKSLCKKVLSLEKCMEEYNDLKKKVSDLTICIEKFTKEKENFEKLFGS
ncbi:hypothetical protein M9H77_30813 [Catharanthus roseus]|uniref:Uncharacterized protein n=1 Tax=Catharanthus roseus TaxID=4058 RepID=A0ACC0A276_CATRO|nr:hypothetical protein M9H77_30813 [Catharanthus roseus]